MNLTTILWIVIVWIFLNALFPLLLNSIERLYQPQIDAAVGRMVGGARFIFLTLFQAILIVYFAPLLLLTVIIERIYPKFFEFEAIKRTGIRPLMHVVVSRRFWPTVAAEIRRINRKEKDSPTNGSTGSPKNPAPGEP
ncbi:MAG: hypothetical protein V1878_09710 [bacterium]